MMVLLGYFLVAVIAAVAASAIFGFVLTDLLIGRLKRSMRNCGSLFYYQLRSYLHQKPRLLLFARIFRAYLILGPLRDSFVIYYRRFSNNKPIRVDASSLFSNLDVNGLVDEIRDVGHAEIGSLPEEYVAEILEYCENNKKINYWNPHKDCEMIDRISRNGTIVAIVKKYLGSEPILWLTQLKWSFASTDNSVNFRTLVDPKTSEYDFHAFHYDTHDFKSLTVFVYLTDVNLDSAPHVTILGSHKNKTLKNLARIYLTDDVAQKLFPDQIKAVLGTKGLVFIEDISGYHKVAVCNKGSRLLLSIDYVLRRKTPAKQL
jgi:hypothetical protein